METRNKYYDIWPLVVREGSDAEISVRPLWEHAAFRSDATYEVTLHPKESLGSVAPNTPVPFRIENGTLVIRHRFDVEQEYLFAVRGKVGDRQLPPINVHVYALRPDLFARRPFKGDLHLHSCRSDGRETPAYVLGACRSIGLDFAGLTDHWNYAASLEGIKTFDGVKIDLRMFPGEEIHTPDNPLHVVNFGGRTNVTDLYVNDRAKYYAEVAAIEAAEAQDLPPGKMRFMYASSVWAFRKTREAGGLAIYPHPYWTWPLTYNCPEPVLAKLFAELPFDAFELIGGFPLWEAEGNSLQVARYYEASAGGRLIPIVGSSDAHDTFGGERFSWYYTIVFAKSTELVDIIEAVKSGNSVAIEWLPNETAHVHGPFRLVKFAWFLLHEFLAKHDELCVEEGRQMRAWAAGDKSAADVLALLSGRTRRLADHLWGA